MVAPVFDTNIVIDQLGGMTPALDEVRRYAKVAISVITWIEVMAGTISGEDEALTRRVLADYQVLPLTPEIAEAAAVIRRERRIKLPDAIIQATAEDGGMLLVTRNEKDFPDGAPGIRIPYRL